MKIREKHSTRRLFQKNVDIETLSELIFLFASMGRDSGSGTRYNNLVAIQGNWP